jgi:uncharacterized protein
MAAQIPPSAVITTEAELRTLINEPAELVKRKVLPALDRHCREFIAQSPFLLLGTHASDGSCDVSPRGDPPGFVRVHDDSTFFIADRPGNRRIDSMRNILQTGRVGVLFLIPTVEDILRVNGSARIIREPEILKQMPVQDKVPLLAIEVTVQEAFMHCARAIKRGRLWDHAQWPPKRPVSTLSEMLCEQVKSPDVTVESLDKLLHEGYTKRLY